MDSIAWIVEQFSAFVDDPVGYRQATPADEAHLAKITEAIRVLQALQEDHDAYRRALLMVNDVVELALLEPAQTCPLVQTD